MVYGGAPRGGCPVALRPGLLPGALALLQPRRCLAPGECTRTARAALPRREGACCLALLRLVKLGRAVLAVVSLACHGEWTCPGPAGSRAQPGPGHAGGGCLRLVVGSRKLPTAPRIGEGAGAVAGGALGRWSGFVRDDRSIAPRVRRRFVGRIRAPIAIV